MTMPDERRRAVNYARDFLRDLLDPKKTPRVPRDIRRRAGSVLRHFPGEYHMEQAKEQAPKIFGEWDSEWRKPEEEKNE